MVSNDMSSRQKSSFYSGSKAHQGELDASVLAYVKAAVDTAGGAGRVVADSPASLKISRAKRFGFKI